jgi:hypothetical protein
MHHARDPNVIFFALLIFVIIFGTDTTFFSSRKNEKEDLNQENISATVHGVTV